MMRYARIPVLALLMMPWTLFGAPVLERGALSAEAQALIPAGNIALIVLKDGNRLQGTVIRESAEEILLRVQQSESIFVGRRVPRHDIASVSSADVAPLLAERLLAVEVSKESSAEVSFYRDLLRLLDEFIEKAPHAEAMDAVRERREAVHADLVRVEAGMEKVAGTWLPPVAASIRNFELFSSQLQAIERQPSFQQHADLKAAHAALVVKRRDIARRAPQLMAERLQPLLNARNFAEAVFETTALLRFWLDQVVASEGQAREVLGQMDFAFLLRMFERIMDSYRQAGLGAAPAPSDAARTADMVFIPGGYFLMGEKTDDPRQDTFPMRLVYVSPFLIDRYEVSNAEYRRFASHVEQTGESWFQHPDAPPLKRHTAAGWSHPHLSRDRQPVVGVDWFDAFAYARWVLGRTRFDRGEMKRLPTEAEWEKAARFTDGRTYPWGQEPPERSMVNSPVFRRQIGLEMDRQNPPEAPPPPRNMFGCVRKQDIPPPPPTVIPDETWDVDKLLPPVALQAASAGVFQPPWKSRDVSEYGVYHMAGNAAEWVQDYYDQAAYQTAPIKDPQGPVSGAVRVLRGGAFMTGAPALAVYRRQGSPVAGGLPVAGFRCAQSLYLVVPADLDQRRHPRLSFEELMRALRDADGAGSAASR